MIQGIVDELFGKLSDNILSFSIRGGEFGNANNGVLLYDVIKFANMAHEGQVRFDGSPFFIHPLRTALNLVDHDITDIIPISAALLHDILEDCPYVSENLVRQRYGNEIADLVKALTKSLDKNAPNRAEKYLMGIVLGPRWVCEIKVADRLDNLRSMFTVEHTGKHKNWPEKYFRQTISEVLPIAVLVPENLRRTFLTELWKVKDRIVFREGMEHEKDQFGSDWNEFS